MSVNGVKIQAGQRWITKGGRKVTINPSPPGVPGSDTYPWTFDKSSVSVTDDGRVYEFHAADEFDLDDLVSLVEDSFGEPTSFPLIDDTPLETSEADAIHPFPEKHVVDAARFQTPGVYGTLTGMPFPKIDFLVQAARGMEVDAAHMSTEGDKHALDAMRNATLIGAGRVYFQEDQADEEFETVTLALEGPYGRLAKVLFLAYQQASTGKGKERHAVGETPFEDQPMATINKQLGSIDGFIYQAHKKSLEAKRLPDGRAQAELLGAINYLAGAVIALDSWAKKTD